MNRSFQVLTASFALLFMLAIGLAPAATAQQATSSAGDTALLKALDNAMDPGEGQKKLEFLVGTFDVKILNWLEPNQPPIESKGTAVHSWVLGHRYVQTMLSASVMGEPFEGIGYVGFDNVANRYVASYIDSASTGMEWYTGALGADGKAAKMTTTIYDAVTHKPVKVEMRLTIDPNGDHVTSLWQADASGKMFKIIELHYTRKNS